MAAEFEIRLANDGQFYFVLQADNSLAGAQVIYIRLHRLLNDKCVFVSLGPHLLFLIALQYPDEDASQDGDNDYHQHDLQQGKTGSMTSTSYHNTVLSMILKSKTSAIMT